ncbi:putative mitochondrial hypothetical protein [Leptomonas pyrrhocoris]|uniref:Uncharacterized protein n=1 Tax=Leptomonas pyrrhocoris TaxID=157538 RepID=A0A0N0DV30_LEPPY|nr:putative mitochondrial hypothetical protein [Leptomonas pyrrhocoris]KPA79764.1 putative mitochondrial hypothetical protein [Leptomonas pyrrhocoris]|eukprot:XP_015658203.1 putative mitochondrial hypothetical protein [Leptomonas pyrrhocoris]
MSTLLEIYRQTFPKRLRFDKASQVLYAQCYSIARQHKHRKYIPQREIRNVLNGYEPMPGAPWLQLPIVRHILLIRLINGFRGYFGYRSWLYNRSVEAEYRAIDSWLDKAVKAPIGRRGSSGGNTSGGGVNSGSNNASSSDRAFASRKQPTAQGRLDGMVERERFEKEVLMNFHVATVYQRMFRVGFVVVLLLCCIIYASLRTDSLVYWYLTYYRRYGRSEVLAYFRDITALHTFSEVPTAYAGVLPPPCVRRVSPTGDVSYAVNIVELVMPDRGVTVFAIPCPQMGERAFFQQVGEVASACDGVVMEGVTFEKSDKLPPVVFLPLKNNTFPVIGVHHRFLDILRRSSDEPPMLYPAGAEVDWRAYAMQVMIPYELRCVYNPTHLSATKGEARIGWGRLRQVLEEVGETGTDSAEQERRVICIPWTLNQIVNIEASLVKYGFTVRNVYPLHWLREDYMGEHFCDYFGIV